VVLIGLALVPLFAEITKRSSYNFRFPLLVMVLSFCLFAAQNSPHFFATSWVGPGRLRNIVYFSYIWLVFGNLYYFVGWLVRTRFEKYVQPRIHFGGFVIGVAILFIVLFIASDNSHMTANQSLHDLRSGLAQQFAEEMDERIAYLESRPNEDIILPRISTLNSNAPTMLSVPYSDLTGDVNYWINVAWARYFGNNSIRIEE